MKKFIIGAVFIVAIFSYLEFVFVHYAKINQIMNTEEPSLTIQDAEQFEQQMDAAIRANDRTLISKLMKEGMDKVELQKATVKKLNLKLKIVENGCDSLPHILTLGQFCGFNEIYLDYKK